MGAHNQLYEELITELVSLDPGPGGLIDVDRNQQHVEIVTAGAETRTLDDPDNGGLILTISMKTDGGDCVIAVPNAFNAAGNNRITLNDAGDTVLLVSIAHGNIGWRWRLMANDGAALSTV